MIFFSCTLAHQDAGTLFCPQVYWAAHKGPKQTVTLRGQYVVTPAPVHACFRQLVYVILT